MAGLLGWLLPGLGHLAFGHRGRGLVFLVTISSVFWTGVAVGGAGATINPEERRLWFAAQLLNGGQTLVSWGLHAYAVSDLRDEPTPRFLGHWIPVDVGIHYTGVAGLLNLLVILDAMARAESGMAGNRPRDPPDGPEPG